MRAVAAARAGGEWLGLTTAAGSTVRVLIPKQALLVIREYEVDEAEHVDDDNDWAGFDWDY
jgi:hypothetical protein